MLRRFALPLPSRPAVITSPLARLPCAASPAAALVLGECIRSKSSSSRAKIMFKGPGWNVKKSKRSLKPVSEWPWAFPQQVADIVHDATLSLPETAMLPAMRVFGELDIDDKILCSWTLPQDAYVYDHCEIEKVADRMGYGLSSAAAPEAPAVAIGVSPPVPDDIHALHEELIQLRMALAEVKKHEAEIGQLRKDIIKTNRRLVEKLCLVRKLSLQAEYQESKVDMCAQAFLQLCGFDEEEFCIDTIAKTFKIFGKTCRSKADVYVVLSKKGDLVLVVEDKDEKKPGSPHAAITKQGHLGQLLGGLLQILSLNRININVFRTVFGLRFISDRVTAFRVDTDKETLATLVDTEYIPTNRLQVRSTVKDPTVERGWSLVDKAERKQALQAMANIRSFIRGQ